MAQNQNSQGQSVCLRLVIFTQILLGNVQVKRPGPSTIASRQGKAALPHIFQKYLFEDGRFRIIFFRISILPFELEYHLSVFIDGLEGIPHKGIKGVYVLPPPAKPHFPKCKPKPTNLKQQCNKIKMKLTQMLLLLELLLLLLPLVKLP